ncbi:hypothetical protein [Microbacterium sp. JB110]|nr:hypothetical protein [Microbacterium sp. JB110]SJM67919.1 hypothetical protein CZ774_15780 [Frigoribacterium sp. JB110]
MAAKLQLPADLDHALETIAAAQHVIDVASSRIELDASTAWFTARIAPC